MSRHTVCGMADSKYELMAKKIVVQKNICFDNSNRVAKRKQQFVCEKCVIGGIHFITYKAAYTFLVNES